MLQCSSPLFPTPYSLLSVTACPEDYAAMLLPAPTHFRELHQSGRKARKSAHRARDKKSPRNRGSKKEFFKIERTTQECL